tara:strand:- start:387 stop:572 length:186 start_codon:yes stop_codon:yes gene_type:complete
MDLYRTPWQLMRDAIGQSGSNFEQELWRSIIKEKVKENEIRREKLEQKKKTSLEKMKKNNS